MWGVQKDALITWHSKGIRVKLIVLNTGAELEVEREESLRIHNYKPDLTWVV